MKKRSSGFAFDRRASGLLLHPTSLPGPFGNGDIGSAAAGTFIDFLAAAGQRWWQMLPVGPPGDGHSPYSASSAFAGHPGLISLDMLVLDGLLKRRELKTDSELNTRRIEHDRALLFRTERLRLAFRRFVSAGGHRQSAFKQFQKEQADWLDDYVLFAAIKSVSSNQPWSSWEMGLRKRKPAALARAREELADEILYQTFVQFEFDRQWWVLRTVCADKGIGLIGDLPIFVAHDSAEVWANPDLFLLDRAGQPKVVSGCPPDFFNGDGQRWGHPHYNWKAHAAEGYRWWMMRFRQTLRWFDAVRIDHFLGFHRVWSIPASCPTAKKGRYTPGPGAAFFHKLHATLGKVPIIAEDLGTVTEEALALRDQFHFPGMRVLQFGFGEGGEYHLPHNCPKCSAVYTGTHDNDTTVGWLDKIPKSERRRVIDYTGSKPSTSKAELTWALIRFALASAADTAIFPVQDLLGLGSDDRMNMPGTIVNNWAWRLQPGKLTPAVARRMRSMSELYGRTQVRA